MFGLLLYIYIYIYIYTSIIVHGTVRALHLTATQMLTYIFRTISILIFGKLLTWVSHARLLLKLQAYRIRGNLLKWIEDYLAGRQQKVIVRNEESEWCNVISGVLQGSVLGPLLFAIYVNDSRQLRV